MTVNRGIAPPAYGTNVGKFRRNVQDITYTALDPVEAGYGDYTDSSDAEIESFLVDGGGSVSRALGEYYLVIASKAAEIAENVKDYDLQDDSRKVYEAYMDISQRWFDKAREEDIASGVGDFFDSFGFGEDEWVTNPEAAPYPVI